MFRNQNKFSFMSIALADLMNRRVTPMPAARHRHRGFTLLEIMLAVAILGMMALAIFRFVANEPDGAAIFIRHSCRGRAI